MKINKKLLLGFYTLTLAAILYYPASVIAKIEFPSAEPVELKFKVRLYDPYDPMRGRYVSLKAFPDSWQAKDAKLLHRTKSSIAAVFEKDADGFAKISRLDFWHNVKPGEPAVRLSHVRFDNGIYRKQYRFELPFKRYYTNEFKAPELEENLQKLSNLNQFMILRVKFYPCGLHAVSGLDMP